VPHADERLYDSRKLGLAVAILGIMVAGGMVAVVMWFMDVTGI
jgi:hypothetical protein